MVEVDIDGGRVYIDGFDVMSSDEYHHRRYRTIAEEGVNMNNRTMLHASRRGEWTTVERLRRITDALLSAYERSVGAIRI